MFWITNVSSPVPAIHRERAAVLSGVQWITVLIFLEINLRGAVQMGAVKTKRLCRPCLLPGKEQHQPNLDLLNFIIMSLLRIIMIHYRAVIIDGGEAEFGWQRAQRDPFRRDLQRGKRGDHAGNVFCPLRVMLSMVI